MAIKLFTDQQKQSLATEAGYKGPFDTNMFNRDDNVQTGESTMYMKLGNNQKFYGANPIKAQLTTNPIASQAENMQSQFGAMPLDAAYNAYLKAIPSSKQTYYDEIGAATGIYAEMQSIYQQQMKMLQTMTGNQSAIFSATNPDGTPVDPRVKVAQYKANMQSATDRVDQLRQLETVYKSQLKVLGDAEFDKAQKQAETAKTALLYMKDLNEQANKERDAQFREKELKQRGSQFDRELDQKAYQFKEENNFRYSGGSTKPELVQDVEGNYKWVSPPEGGFGGQSGMRTDRHMNPTAFTTQIAKQAGLVEGKDYSVGDPFGDKGQFNTAKIIGDPVATTIKVIDKIGFKTQSGASRWTYTDSMGLTNEVWSKMNTEQKTNAIKQMYKHEGGNGSVFGTGGTPGVVTETGVQGAPKKGAEISYEDRLISVGKELESVENVSMKDANELIDAMSKQYPSKKREDIVKGLWNASPDRMKIAIDSVGISMILNDLTPKTVKSTLDKLAVNYDSIESVFKAFNDAGFFEKYADKVWDSEQLDAAQEWFDDNGYDLTDGKIKKN